MAVRQSALGLQAMIAEALKAYSGRRVLVTGHTGFKGAWLCAWLERLGSKTTGYALPPEGRSLFLQARISDRMRSLEGDVRDLAHLQAAVREARSSSKENCIGLLPMSSSSEARSCS